MGRGHFGMTLLGALAAGGSEVPREPPAGDPAPPPARSEERDDAAAEKLGWRLGTQAWTFRDRTAFEVIDTARRLGLKYVEFYPGQPLRPVHRDVKLGPEMSGADLAAFQKKLADCHVRAVSFGVVDFGNDEAKGRELFEFGKALGLENFSAEPEPDAFDLLEKLANEYSIRVAIHNHPSPKRYWSPDVVLAAVKGRGKRIGACADTGHWTRSGLKPVDCLKKLEGRVLELHFKDLDQFGRHDALDIPWGAGKSDARGILVELKRQAFQGLISIEYENGSGAELEQNVAKCIAFFDQAAREISAPAN